MESFAFASGLSGLAFEDRQRAVLAGAVRLSTPSTGEPAPLNGVYPVARRQERAFAVLDAALCRRPAMVPVAFDGIVCQELKKYSQGRLTSAEL